MSAPVPDAALIGRQIRTARKAQRLTQTDLTLVANVGVRFIVDVESGKKTCQLGLALSVMRALGMRLEIYPPGHDMDALQDLTVDFDTGGGFQL
jgi:DNA-binding XRE family transcriptional regulator